MAFEVENNKLIRYVSEPEVRKVVIPDGIEVIKKYSFAGCNNIESVHIPKSVRLIYCSAFLNCPNLMSFSVDKDNAKFYTVNGCLYERLPNNSGSLVKVPEGMEYIELPDTS
ncbi:MAG: leucine-rich repeat domain-containing protein [Ruminococcus flavefaciens]|nr:leucine-rich repeat domain-containing protein [Ruminococcus flavefaciens]